MTKIFVGRASSQLWFSWDDLPPVMGTEAKLSRLARWVLLGYQNSLRYGLKLPGVEVPLGEGEAQLDRCLRELALYDALPPDGGHARGHAPAAPGALPSSISPGYSPGWRSPSHRT